MSKTYGTMQSGRGNLVTKAGTDFIAATVSTYQNTIKVTMYDNNTVSVIWREGTYNSCGDSASLFDGTVEEFKRVIEAGRRALAGEPVEA